MIGQLSSLVGDEVGTRVYGLLNRVQLWRVCAVFFLFFPRRSLFGKGSPGGRREDRVQLWRICAVFFSDPLPPA